MAAAVAGGGAARALSQKEQDIQMMRAADVHLGTKNCDFQMEHYVFKRRTDGILIINLGKTWEKLQLAARVIAIENLQDIMVQFARPCGQRAVLKFAQYTGTHAIAGRHTPGTFTNQLQTSFSEPRLLILTDPRTDHQLRVVLMDGIKQGPCICTCGRCRFSGGCSYWLGSSSLTPCSRMGVGLKSNIFP